MKTKTTYLGLGILIIILLGFFILPNSNSNESNNLESLPEKIVKQYFESWNNQDYGKMYEVISDGFKEIDPNAKDLESFRNYASSQNIKGVKIIKISETSNNGNSASVDYSVEFGIIGGNIFPFEGTFTLKYRKDDKVSGWKLIHPYGENIDTS